MVKIPCLDSNWMQAIPEQHLINPEATLQLLLFVDQRPASQERIRRIRQYLDDLKIGECFELQVIDVGEQPYLAEHFKLIATPTLIKIYPEPRQMLAGSDLVAQLEHWWPRWQQSTDGYKLDAESSTYIPSSETALNSANSVVYAAEVIKLSDEIFHLKQERELLAQQLQFKDRIIEILAHDLRSPLTAASLALETLASTQNPKNPNAPQITPALKERLIEQARHQVRAMDRMITDILQTAAGPSTQLQIHPCKLEIGEFVKQILVELEEQFRTKLLHLKIDIPLDTPAVYADPERIRQVMMNLLDNGIKYTPKGGLIHVCILHRTSQKVQVSICDSGPGIPEENRDRIFQDRFRLERDEAKDGYGIGLSLCKRIVAAHYGQIWVDSGFTTGSCFHFTLPVYH